MNIIPRFYYTLRATQYRKYFKTNGWRSWQSIHFTGFREAQSSLSVHAQWVGMTNTGDHYYTATKIDCSGEWKFASKQHRENWMRDKENMAKHAIDLFLDPRCRCRLGYHWECELHHTWVN
jgi:hypothetical protein